MLKELNTDEGPEQSQWLSAFWKGELPCIAWGQLVCFGTYSSSTEMSFCPPQISAGASCPCSPTSSAASTRAWLSASCRTRTQRRTRAVGSLRLHAGAPERFVLLTWHISGLHSSQQLRAECPFQPLRPQTSGVVFQEHGGLSPHHGPGPSCGTHVLPQAARRRLPLSSAVCKQPQLSLCQADHSYFLEDADWLLPVPLQALLLGIGLQHKSVSDLEKEIDLPSSQLMGLFNRLIRKFVQVSRNHWRKFLISACYSTYYQNCNNIISHYCSHLYFASPDVYQHSRESNWGRDDST